MKQCVDAFSPRHLRLRIFIFFLQRDRLTSFRKSGVKKERLLIQHPIDSPASINELPVAQPLFDERSMNLSEKEVMDLFEKMMVSFNILSGRVSILRTLYESFVPLVYHRGRQP